jgi:hypothetical protein
MEQAHTKAATNYIDYGFHERPTEIATKGSLHGMQGAVQFPINSGS